MNKEEMVLLVRCALFRRFVNVSVQLQLTHKDVRHYTIAT